MSVGKGLTAVFRRRQGNARRLKGLFARQLIEDEEKKPDERTKDVYIPACAQ